MFYVPCPRSPRGGRFVFAEKHIAFIRATFSQIIYYCDHADGIITYNGGTIIATTLYCMIIITKTRVRRAREPQNRCFSPASMCRVEKYYTILFDITLFIFFIIICFICDTEPGVNICEKFDFSVFVVNTCNSNELIVSMWYS